MNIEPDEDEDLLQDDEDQDQGNEHQEDDVAGDDDDGAAANDDEKSEDDEDVISFGGVEQRGEDEPEHIRDLRKGYREQQRRIRELEAGNPGQQAVDIGPKPTMDDDDVQWDADKFEAKLLKWSGDKQAIEDRQTRQREEQQRVQREYEGEVAEFDRQRGGLRVRNFDAAHDAVLAAFSDVQQALSIQASENKAALWYALGTNPTKLKELASISNPVKFAAAIARLDMEVKVDRRKPTTEPESRRSGGGGTQVSAGAGNRALEKLEAEAAKTGDRSAVIAYKRKMAQGGK